MRMECAPAFNYARSAHTTEIILDTSVASPSPTSPGGPHHCAVFSSPEAKLDLDLRFVAEASLENVMEPEVEFQLLDLEKKGHKGPGVFSDITLKEGQAVTFILREPPNVKLPSQAHPTHELAHQIGVPYESALSVMLVPVHSLIPIRRACGGGVQSAFSRRPNFDESKHCRYHPNTN